MPHRSLTCFKEYSLHTTLYCHVISIVCLVLNYVFMFQIWTWGAHCNYYLIIH